MHAGVEGATLVSSCLVRDRLVNVRGLRIHMIGIGGSGMSGAAALLRARGAEVSGSDLAQFEGLGQLIASGVRVTVGQRAANVDEKVEVVVASAAIPAGNPELVAARDRGLPVVKYAEVLGTLMSGRDGVAIAGTHGKSTTSGLAVHLLREAGLSPSFVIGARSWQLGGNGGAGEGRHFVVEACEFDRSFLQFHPRYAAILNVEPDHLDCYRDVEEIVDAFGDFARNVSGDGLLVCNGEDERAIRAARRCVGDVETFGFLPSADWRATELESDRGRFAFNVRHRGSVALSTRLSIPGVHNVANALAAIAIAMRCGADPAKLAAGVSSFAGVDRRMTWRGRGRGVTIVDDYAHHPTEIQVTLRAAIQRYVPTRVWVVFQPHQAARTRHFMSEFAESFEGVEEIIVPDIYGARETEATANPMGSAELVARIKNHGVRARYEPQLKDIARYLTDRVDAGDLVLTMGAGDVWKVADELVERLCRSDRAGRAAGEADVVSTRRGGAVPVPAA
ncbi:MAG: UDP-N-acetylmuramate--L-alanine ligase [Planctomycetota bacterium]